jgi:putative ABC transport system permease protein
MALLPLEYAFRNLNRSPWRFLAIVLGSFLVVVLIQTASAFVRGMEKSLRFQNTAENVLLLSTGSEESLERSEIEGNTASLLRASISGIKSTLETPSISPEIHIALIVKQTQQETQERRALFRGVTPNAFLVYPRVEVLEGHPPRAGHDEIMIGSLVPEKLGIPLLPLGSSLWVAKRSWTIVGKFQAPATLMDGEIWIPLSDLQLATKREGLSTVVLTLDSAEFEDIDAFTKQRVDLELVALRESDYYSALLRFYRPVHLMIGFTAFLMALSGLLGGFNVLYAAFSSRIREVGMLQSLGFSRFAILFSFFQESVMLTSLGALLASAFSLGVIDGLSVRFSMGIFQLVVDPYTLSLGLITGISIGILGAIPPTWRCLRPPIYEALKAF